MNTPKPQAKPSGGGNSSGAKGKGNSSKGNSSGAKGKGNPGKGNSSAKGKGNTGGASSSNKHGNKPKPGIKVTPGTRKTPGNGKNSSNNKKPGNKKHAGHNHNKPGNNHGKLNRKPSGKHTNKPNGHRCPQHLHAITSRPTISRHWGSTWHKAPTIWNPHHSSHHHRPVILHNNFRNSINYAYRPNAWGSRPWWSAQTHHSWRRGSWNYGWNNQWRNHINGRCPQPHRPPGYLSQRSGLSTIVPWGLSSWSLGSLFYDTGYSSYRNPYSAPPVQAYSETLTYSEPIARVAANRPLQSDEEELTEAEKSSEALELARTAFREGDYLAALMATDEAISHQPGDSTLHEFRALSLFALGRYGDASGVLNPVLASGPGWDWDTMDGFYETTDTYIEQLRKLEEYATNAPDSADSRFLLGYHYMVAGHLDEAYAMFDRVAELQPTDSVAIQLRDLAASSKTEDEEDSATLDEGTVNMDDLVILPETAIVGTWTAQSVDEKEITLSLKDDGTFSWDYEGKGEEPVLTGDWSIDDEGLLVLADEDVQMVGDIDLEKENSMRFILAGSPEGDPGLLFQRQ